MILRQADVARPPLFAVLLLAVLALAGCNGAPISTQWKLRGFSPATADIAQLRVAVRPPAWAVLIPEKTILAARYDFADGAPGPTLDIRLRRAAHAADRAALAQLARAPESLVIYEAAPGDLDAIRAFQAELQKAKQAGRQGKGGFVETRGHAACRLTDIPDGPILVDAYIHASDEIGWLLLAEGYDVRGKLRPEEVDGRAPPCEKTAGRAGR